MRRSGLQMSIATSTVTAPGRTVDRILMEWRDAELRLQDQPWDAENQELVEQLRIEYMEAIRSRLAEAEELSRPPRLLLD